MIIVDTSVIIDFFTARANPSALWLKQRSREQRIGITTLVQLEVLQGIREEKVFLETQRALDQFEIFETGSSQLEITSAHNFRALRKKGITIRSTIDCLIATFCIEDDHVLLHNDRDFDYFEQHLGLKVFHPPVAKPH
jgi:hypothetical protein